MRSKHTLIILTIICTLTVVGCTSVKKNANEESGNTIQKTQPTSKVQVSSQAASIDVKTGVSQMIAVAADLKNQITAGDEAKIKVIGPQLEETWRSFEDSVKTDYQDFYGNIEKILDPTVAASKASTLDKQALAKLTDQLIQGLNELGQKVNPTKSTAAQTAVEQKDKETQTKTQASIDTAATPSIDKGSDSTTKNQSAPSTNSMESTSKESSNIKTGVTKMLSIAADLKIQLNANDEAKIKAAAPQLEEAWVSFEDDVKAKSPDMYAKVEKYLFPTVAASKAIPLDKQTLLKLVDLLTQSLNDLEQKVK